MIRTVTTALFTIAAATLSLGVAAGPAIAETVSMPVSYAGLDLGSPAGMRTLEARIARAASRLCGDQGSRDIKTQQAVRACRAEVMASGRTAVASLRPAQLAAR